MGDMESTDTPSAPDRFFEFDGLVAAAGFASGDRVVVGHWHDSPIGPFSDVTWSEPDGWRTRFVVDEVVKRFVTAIDVSDSVILAPGLAVGWSPEESLLEVTWPGAAVEFGVGRTVPLPEHRPRVRVPIGRKATAVDRYGVSATGVYEWHRTKWLRRIVSGWAVVAGRDLGEPGPPGRSVEFGLSEVPPFAALTERSTRLHDPTHHLDDVVDELRLARIESMAEFLRQQG